MDENGWNAADTNVSGGAGLNLNPYPGTAASGQSPLLPQGSRAQGQGARPIYAIIIIVLLALILMVNGALLATQLFSSSRVNFGGADGNMPSFDSGAVPLGNIDSGGFSQEDEGPSF
jgi:hypothetical protein